MRIKNILNEPNSLLAEYLHTDLATIKKVKQIIRGTLDPLSFKSASQYKNQCYNTPADYLLKLYALNELLELFGVEAIENKGIYINSYFGNFTYDYLNTGDTYALTIIRCNKTGKFFISSWGNVAEQTINQESEGVK